MFVVEPLWDLALGGQHAERRVTGDQRYEQPRARRVVHLKFRECGEVFALLLIVLHHQRLAGGAHPADDAFAPALREHGRRQALAVAHPDLDVVGVVFEQPKLEHRGGDDLARLLVHELGQLVHVQARAEQRYADFIQRA